MKKRDLEEKMMINMNNIIQQHLETGYKQKPELFHLCQDQFSSFPVFRTTLCWLVRNKEVYKTIIRLPNSQKHKWHQQILVDSLEPLTEESKEIIVFHEYVERKFYFKDW